ncbi:siroheme decarboxylase subunit beta [Achromobacter marplatensis]|uniref:siroheme decarboxylase subunit beta n=1 Tax=Achromobacter marplatensis TaxID=470868 RepID=UPI0039F6AF99
MPEPPLDPLDLALIRATQTGLPMVREPYRAVAAKLGVSDAEVMARLQLMLERGIIRRIGVVPNHYALGLSANGMSVWDIEDAHADAVGSWLGSLPDVTHCYRRPRRPPLWSYNLFAMLHGSNHDTVRVRIARIADMLHARFPGVLRSRDVLFSSAILKKTGIRLRSE